MIEYNYANMIDITIFTIFGMTYYVNMSLIDTFVHAVMQKSMWPHCVLTAWGLWTLFRVSSDLQCKDTLNTCPTSWFVARYFKESSIPYGFF